MASPATRTGTQDEPPAIAGGEISIPLEHISQVLDLVTELRESGRAAEADAVYALVKAELARQDAALDADVSPALEAALARGDEQIAAGKFVPHEIVTQGRAAVDEFVRKRDAHDLAPETANEIAAAAAAYREELKKTRPASAGGA